VETLAFALMAISTLGLIVTLKYAQSNPEAYQPFGHKDTPKVKDGQNPAAMNPALAEQSENNQKKLDAAAGTRKVDKSQTMDKAEQTG